MKYLSFLLWWQLALTLVAADPQPAAQAVGEDPKTEANIAKSVGRVLESLHYSRMKFDDEVSEKFLDRYIDNLDGQKLLFLQSDIDEFQAWRTQLDDLTLRQGDTSPGHKIFARLLERLDQRVGYVTNLLSSERFTFKGEDHYMINRKDAARPKDLQEARQLWRQLLRYEYLQEKLSWRQKNEKAEENAAKTSRSKLSREAAVTPDPEAKPEGPEAAAAKPETPAKILSPEEIHAEIVKKLTARYARLARNFKEVTRDEVLELYLTALAHVYDPHSDYMGRRQTESFSISMRLSLSGIGAELTMEDDYCQVRRLLPGGPAIRSKQIKEGDRIVAVAQGDKEAVDCVGMKLSKVVEMIRGPKGTEVRLTILPVDAADPSVRKIVSLVRDEVKLEDQEAKAKVIEMPGEEGKTVRIGVIDLPSFYEDMDTRKAERKSTSADIAKLLKKLNEEKVSGLILDLRRNGGGALSEAIKLTGLFIKKGPVVQTMDFRGEIGVKSDPDSTVHFDGPMVVLTSRFSASASEILAGALQDYGRALVVGDSSTHGKGTVQQVLYLADLLKENGQAFAYDPGALKLTIQKFYRAGGASTQLRGVVPDIVLPSVNNYAEVGESSLDNPLPWDQVSPEKFERFNRVEPYREELKRRSTTRTETDQDFKYIRDDIDRFKKTLAEKTVSLNEAQRIKEMEEQKAISEARKKERLARKTPEQKVYEVTLRNVSEPGLIPAAAKESAAASVDAEATFGDEEESDRAPAVDPTLNEAKRILVDYISLMKDPRSVTLVE